MVAIRLYPMPASIIKFVKKTHLFVPRRKCVDAHRPRTRIKKRKSCLKHINSNLTKDKQRNQESWTTLVLLQTMLLEVDIRHTSWNVLKELI